MKLKRLVQCILVLPALFALASVGAVHYSYDQAGRLARVEYANGKSIAYTYDDAGNLMSRSITASGAAGPDITAGPALQGRKSGAVAAQRRSGTESASPPQRKEARR